VLDEIYRNPAQIDEKSRNAQRLAREVFSWDRAVMPLFDLLERQAAAPNKFTDIMIDFPESADFPIYQEHLLSQYFVCRMPGLQRVDCRIATHGRAISEPVTFRLYAVERESASRTLEPTAKKGKLLVENIAPPEMLTNNEWYTLETAPISKSEGKTFLLEIESTAKDKTSSISPWAIKSNPYPLVGCYYKNEKLPHAGICMRTICAGFSSEKS